MLPNVFDYNDPVDFLNASFSAIQSKNPQFSLRAWARQLGLPHVTMLSMVLNRKRRLLPNLSSKIGEHFVQKESFSENQARYFDMLVLFANARTTEEKAFYQKVLSSLRPDQTFLSLQLDHLRFISDWYHIAILEMTHLKEFNSDPRWICLRLGDSVSQSQVSEAIDRLVRLGLLERTSDNGLRKTTARLATPSDIPDKGLRKFHSQMMQKALEALERQTVSERDITGHTLVTSLSKIPVAKTMIREFRRRLADFLETPEGDALYQINIQLFKLTGDSHVD